MPKKTPDTPPQLPTRPPTPEEEAWHVWRRADEQDTPKRLEEAAKFCTGLYGITYAILLGSDANALRYANENTLKLVAGLWLVSLVAAFVVIFPLPWVYRSDSAASIAAMHRRVVRFKYRALLLSAGLYLFALGVLTWLYFK
ncbi:MAG: hypothetical protein R3D58_12160 [Saprospiraceae bacterium]